MDAEADAGTAGRMSGNDDWAACLHFIPEDASHYGRITRSSTSRKFSISYSSVYEHGRAMEQYRAPYKASRLA
ncbi:hypothetical protein K491DRAFT_688146 [Lophiostoma macrostomum CBS 122681]|uniref:Uncharacterized protein n=1 Tax=Lophiostoma macrostomum CBS 122681 TaxID=1314788 RepID=A0A6A6TNB3_9PLEO|nr:hypothetical protein K491DRAFT_688146 [Lophiostoma macrostomum CBS 122681]